MMIYPAIDLRGGQVVRLHQGDYAQETRYPPTPEDLAQQYREAGAEWLHVVDLDGARTGHEANRPLIRQLARLPGLRIQAGGGVRSRAEFDALCNAGVRRVVVGSLFVRQPEEIERWLQESKPELICVALDVRDMDGDWVVQSSGWRESSRLTLNTALDMACRFGARHFLVTDIGRDGTLAGPNLALYHELVPRYPHARIQASGGVSCLADLVALRDTGVAGVIVGKALLEGRFTLAEARAAC